ncbi:MAG: alkaline phosphatase family protein [Sphaerochaetaceae bacterium]|nr:alkaline phosphatase family protein [Sphaerochaetaceae bacterium]MDC7247302.1 alkaline phosphatase family protein [Sphaerochaetaceae bacterium]
MKKESVSLSIFIDALGWEILQSHSFLDDELIHKQDLRTIFGYSATCDPTILTGALPRDHGHFSFYAYDPEHSPFKGSPFIQMMRLVPKALSSRNRVRNIAGRIIRRRLDYTGYFNIYNMPFKLLHMFDYTEKKDLYQKGGINSGIPTITDYARDNNVDFFLADWKAGEEENLGNLKDALGDENRNITFAYLYMASMDAILHQYGKDHPEVDKKMAWYETQIRQLLSKAQEHYKEVRLFIFSDHGMTDVHTDFNLMKLIEQTPLKFGTDYAAVYDSTMARFWFLSDDSEKIIRQVLENVNEGQILSDSTLEKWGVDFPDKRFGDLFFLMNPGVLIVPSHMGERTIAGMHGYSPDDKDSTAAFASNVELDTYPRGLEDLYSLFKQEIDRCMR